MKKIIEKLFRNSVILRCQRHSPIRCWYNFKASLRALPPLLKGGGPLAVEGFSAKQSRLLNGLPRPHFVRPRNDEKCHAELASASPSVILSEAKNLELAHHPTLSRICKFAFRSLTNSTLSQRERVCAFTLAEVLITLGIIGVVAALTLPTLIQNYQKQVWVNQLKKSVSTIEQGFKQALSEDEVFDLQDTELFLSLQGNEYQYPDNDGYNDFNNKLKKYFKVIKFDSERSGNEWQLDYKYLNSNEEVNDDDANVLYLSDGTELFMYLTPEHWYLDRKNCEIIKSLGGKMCDHMGSIYIDINGDKSPNTLGRDLFVFYLAPNGNLYPHGGIDYAIMDRQQEINNNKGYWRNYEGGICGSKQYDGWACAARIIENGWVMDY